MVCLKYSYSKASLKDLREKTCCCYLKELPLDSKVFCPGTIEAKKEKERLEIHSE